MDIDIDTPTHFDPVAIFPQATGATIVNNGKIAKHPAGVYFQQVKRNPYTGTAAIPYNLAPALGLFKVDFLHLSLLDGIQSKGQLREMINREPNWSLLERDDVIERLFQMKNHPGVIKWVRPKSIQELADCVALIRPGRRYLLDEYHHDVEHTRRELYKLPLPKGCFKKAHAVAYALNIIIQLHTIEKELNGYCEF